jgi:drug/metabolite transporter (DMT)-like permease
MKTSSILQIVLLSAVWGVSFLMIRIAGSAFPPLWVALLRCALGAGLLWVVLGLGGHDPIGLATTQLSLAGLMILPLAVAWARPSNVHLGPVAAIAVLGFAGSGFAYLLYYRLLSQVSATHVAAVTYLPPLWGLFWGYLLTSRSGCLPALG